MHVCSPNPNGDAAIALPCSRPTADVRDPRISIRVFLQGLFGDEAHDTRRKAIAMYLLLFSFNAGAWAWALLAFRHFPLLLGTAMLAYSFGLRHAVDADHIAAIDNVTRKLMQEGKRPVARCAA